jgi:hypothetical protein
VGKLFVLVALATLVAAAPAAAKGLQLTMRADDRTPAAGQRVQVSVRGVADEAVTQPCRRMRVVVVSPGVSVKRALRSLEGGTVSRRIGAWGAFRLASLRSTGELRWEGLLRPHRPGRWTLVVPNWCAAGYVLPGGVARIHLDVRPADAP